MFKFKGNLVNISEKSAENYRMLEVTLGIIKNCLFQDH